MQVAQRLYENGYITYMRTDSSALSNEAITAARRQASELYGPEYVPASPRVYSGQAPNPQGAPEATPGVLRRCSGGPSAVRTAGGNR